jgi:hypothetical protein
VYVIIKVSSESLVRAALIVINLVVSAFSCHPQIRRRALPFKVAREKPKHDEFMLCFGGFFRVLHSALSSKRATETERYAECDKTKANVNKTASSASHRFARAKIYVRRGSKNNTKKRFT